MANRIAQFIHQRRKQERLTQQDIADMTGISYATINKMEQGIGTQRVATVNQILALFGHELAPVPIEREKEAPDA